MFTIYNDQVDALSIPHAQKKRTQIIEELTKKEAGKVYEDDRNVIVEDSKGNRTTILFNEDYFPSGIIKPSGIQLGFECDKGRLIRFLLPGEEKIEWVYYDNMLKGIGFNEKIYILNYDGESRLSSIVYPDKKKLRLHYNTIGQLIKIINRKEANRQFEIHIRENRLVFKNTDELGRVTEFENEGSGYISKVIYPDGDMELFSWNENLNSENSVLRNGSERTIFYDEVDIRRIEYQDGSFINLDYDEATHVTTFENESGTAYYKDDHQEGIICEGFEESQIHLLFDADGLLEEMVYPSGLKVIYQYDEDQKLVCLSINNKKCRFRYGINGTLSAIYYPNRTVEHRKQKILEGLEEICLYGWYFKEQDLYYPPWSNGIIKEYS